MQDNLARMPSWMPTIIRTHMDTLGRIVEDRMREAVAPNLYTGALSESIKHHAEDGGYTTVIEPLAKRGNWDAGTILEMGTRPIPNAPWAPIKRWAEFRGLPGWPVLYKIRTQGVDAHPFLERTDAASQPHLTETARRIIDEAADKIVHGGGKIGLPGG